MDSLLACELQDPEFAQRWRKLAPLALASFYLLSLSFFSKIHKIHYSTQVGANAKLLFLLRAILK
jgi:hypothetical protein